MRFAIRERMSLVKIIARTVLNDGELDRLSRSPVRIIRNI